MTENHQKENEENKETDAVKKLISLAYSLGASEAKRINPSAVLAEESLADLCMQPRCKNYGLAPSCPPHVSGPNGFKKLRKTARHALVMRIIVPMGVLLSDERRPVMQLLHELVSGVENAALEEGFNLSKGFAGGSCKFIFCPDLPDCPVIKEQGPCLFPDSARPSMSGFGINVGELMKTCGWPSEIKVQTDDKNEDAMSWIAGLVLLG